MIEYDFEQTLSVAERIAAVRAATIARLHGLPRDERRDLEQEALLHLWRMVPFFDPRRGSWPTFAERIIANRLQSLMRSQHALCRARRKEQPHDEPVSAMVAPNDRIDLRLDVRRVLVGVSQLDRVVALSLMYQSVAEASRSLGISRATTYRSIGRLQVAFLSAGLRPGDHVKRLACVNFRA